MAASAGATFADRGTEAGTKAEADERSARQATTRAICGEQQPKHNSSGKVGSAPKNLCSSTHRHIKNRSTAERAWQHKREVACEAHGAALFA
jgi:hypothetical protein